MREHRDPLIGALIAGIHVVALSQGDGSRAYKYRIKSNYRTSRIAQCAVDAHAELLVVFQLLRRLEELALAQRRLFLADEPRFYLLQLDQEVAEFGDQVAD